MHEQLSRLSTKATAKGKLQKRKTTSMMQSATVKSTACTACRLLLRTRTYGIGAVKSPWKPVCIIHFPYQLHWRRSMHMHARSSLLLSRTPWTLHTVKHTKIHQRQILLKWERWILNTSSFADAPLYVSGFCADGPACSWCDNTACIYIIIRYTQTDLWTIYLFYPRSRHTVRILMFFSLETKKCSFFHNKLYRYHASIQERVHAVSTYNFLNFDRFYRKMYL